MKECCWKSLSFHGGNDSSYPSFILCVLYRYFQAYDQRMPRLRLPKNHDPSYAHGKLQLHLQLKLPLFRDLPRPRLGLAGCCPRKLPLDTRASGRLACCYLLGILEDLLVADTHDKVVAYKMEYNFLFVDTADEVENMGCSAAVLERRYYMVESQGSLEDIHHHLDRRHREHLVEVKIHKAVADTRNHLFVDGLVVGILLAENLRLNMIAQQSY